MPIENLPKPTLLTTEEFKEILKKNEQLICGNREVSDKNCSNCIHYYCEPMQGGSVDVCTAKKGEFYGSYVIKNINNICPKYETPFMKKNKQKATKQTTEQAIFKEFEEDGWVVENDKETGIITFDNGVMRVIFYTCEEVYECVHFTLKPAMVDAELHLRIHKLLEIWGWIDE